MAEHPRKFIHKGEDCMSFKGYFVSNKAYYFHSNNHESDETIFLEHGTAFTAILDEQDRQIDRWHKSCPKIRNMQEHYEYILKNFIEFEEAVKIREKMKDKMDEQIIHMMPVAFAWVLSIHLLQQKRQGRGSVKPTAPESKSNFMDFEEDGDPLDIL